MQPNGAHDELLLLSSVVPIRSTPDLKIGSGSISLQVVPRFCVGRVMRAISANTNCVVMADGAVARVSSGTQAGAVVGAILDHAVWLVIRDRSGYALHRKRMPLGELLLVIAERGALFVAGCGLHVADLDQEILCGCHPRERRRG